MNYLETAAVFQNELNQAAVEQATSGWMEVNDKLIKYDGGKEVKIPKVDMDGLADYDAEGEGFVNGDINFEYETKTMEQDRGRAFSFDENAVNETNFVLTASTVMGKFQRDKVIPEIDAYRYSTIASMTIKAGNGTGGYNPTESDILQKLYYDIAAVQDVVGNDTPLVITMTNTVAAILTMSDKISRKLDVAEFKQGNVSLKVKSLDGMYPIRQVSAGRMKTEYQFLDGKTSEQKKGGFIPAKDAKDINWIICPLNAPLAVSRTDKMRIFDPETNQKKRAWAMDYRKYHDLWLTEEAIQRCRVNVKQDISQGE